MEVQLDDVKAEVGSADWVKYYTDVFNMFNTEAANENAAMLKALESMQGMNKDVLDFIFAKMRFDATNVEMLRTELKMLAESHKELIDHIKKEVKRFNSHNEPYSLPMEEN